MEKHTCETSRCAETIRTCNGCGENKPVVEYHKHKSLPSGHVGTCKTCRAVRVKSRYNRVKAQSSEHVCDVSGCTETVKRCSGCDEAKPLSDYHRWVGGEDGHRNVCKVCRATADKTRYESTPEHICEKSGCAQIIKTCATCGEDKPLSNYSRSTLARDFHRGQCKRCAYAFTKAWREGNHESVAAYKKTYNAENRVEIRAWQRANRAERYASDPEFRAKVIASNLRRRRLLAEARQEHYIREDIFERDNWTCQLCYEPIDPDLRYPDREAASVDHIVPVSLGGDDTTDNVQASHLACNAGKHNRVDAGQVA